MGAETHQWTTLRNLVELLTLLGAYASAARLLGAVSTATRPTFGPEQRRLEEARATLQAHLGEEADALISAFHQADLDAAVEIGLDALHQLQG